MIRLFANILIPESGDPKRPEARRACGVFCGAAGIVLNLLLFAGKFWAGIVSSSISVTADAFNNLSDAGSSLITIVGFHMASQKPDPEHPFGHGRAEYLSGFIVSLLILLMGIELLRSSLDKVVHPVRTVYALPVFLMLALAILVKLDMAFCYRKIGRKIESASIAAGAADSLSDALSTAAVLAAALADRFTPLAIDGWCGILVSLWILWAGIRAAKETASPLLGQRPDPELVARVRQLVLSCPDVSEMHDLIVHNYGPGCTLLSLHAEVPATDALLRLHRQIDAVEKQIEEELHCQAVIHMDPVLTQDRETEACKALVCRLLREMDPALSMHDFRIEPEEDGIRVLFDLAVPFDYAVSQETVRGRLCARIKKENPRLHPVVSLDTSFDSP